MLGKKPIRKPVKDTGCEVCIFRVGDFTVDSVYPDVTRVYCKARHVDVDAEVMSKDCDFFKYDSSGEKPKQDQNRYGL
jgi:hypothetical protein